MRELNANEIEQVSGSSFAEGVAICAGAIATAALAPVAVPILSVAGLALLAVDVAGAAIMSQ
ncbi:MAG TPA: hypothetical protein VFX47_05725 [Gammaproteobacteria bacterium]|nr:hypothetical protein [Gammaproteobacteria bacterium]